MMEINRRRIREAGSTNGLLAVGYLLIGSMVMVAGFYSASKDLPMILCLFQIAGGMLIVGSSYSSLRNLRKK